MFLSKAIMKNMVVSTKVQSRSSVRVSRNILFGYLKTCYSLLEENGRKLHRKLSNVKYTSQQVITSTNPVQMKLKDVYLLFEEFNRKWIVNTPKYLKQRKMQHI